MAEEPTTGAIYKKIDTIHFKDEVEIIDGAAKTVYYKLDLPADATPSIAGLVVSGNTTLSNIQVKSDGIYVDNPIYIYSKYGNTYEKLGTISANIITLGANNGMALNKTVIEGGSLTISTEGGVVMNTGLSGNFIITGPAYSRPTYNGTDIALKSDLTTGITMSSDGTTLTISYNE